MGTQHSDAFSIVAAWVVKGDPTWGDQARETIAVPIYRTQSAGLCFGGSWDEVTARLKSEASTSSQGLLIRGIDSDPHPKPAVASRVRQLKEDSGLTWDQLRRLLGVSRRAVHMWAGGGQINAKNEERLALLEQIVAALGGRTPTDRRSRLLSPSGRGRSVFQELASSASPTAATRVDIEALTESTGDGNTIHGDFLFTEVIDDGEQDR
ncbi:MAG: helix-turn-helix transcriptional regulator [Acidimicrobiaceae bacterium]|nr:helix-turn-helix transcriptional regulator [Acidimicrobiaceae bacterium]